MAIRASEKLIAAISRYQAGDETAFDTVYYESLPYITRCVLNVVNKTVSGASEDVVQDIIQETYMIVATKLNSLQNPVSFLQWAGQIATHLAEKTWVRDSRRYQMEMPEEELLYEPIDESFIPEDILQNREAQRIIRQILEELPTAQYLCVVEYFYNGLKEAQVAKKLSMPLNTVKTNLRRAKQKIKDSVLSTEKKHGIRLHSMAWLLWIYFLQDLRKIAVDPAQQSQMLVNIKDGLAKGGIGAAAAAAAEAADATVAAGSTAAAAAGGSAAAGTVSGGAGILAGIGAKIVALTLAIAVTVGGAVGVSKLTKEEDPNIPKETVYTAEELESLREMMCYMMAAGFGELDYMTTYPSDLNEEGYDTSINYIRSCNNMMRLIIANEGDRFFPVEIRDDMFVYAYEHAYALSADIMGMYVFPDMEEENHDPRWGIRMEQQGEEIRQTRTGPIETGELLLNSIEQVTPDRIRVHATYIPTENGLVSGQMQDCVFFCKRNICPQYSDLAWTFHLVSCTPAGEQLALDTKAPEYTPKVMKSVVVNKDPYATLSVRTCSSGGRVEDYSLIIHDSIFPTHNFEATGIQELRLPEGKYTVCYDFTTDLPQDLSVYPLEIPTKIRTESYTADHTLAAYGNVLGYYGSFEIYVRAGENTDITIEVPVIAEVIGIPSRNDTQEEPVISVPEETVPAETAPAETEPQKTGAAVEPFRFSPEEITLLERLIGTAAFPSAQDGVHTWCNSVLEGKEMEYGDSEIAWRTLLSAARGSDLIESRKLDGDIYTVSRDDAVALMENIYGFIPESAEYPFATGEDTLTLDTGMETYDQYSIFNIQHLDSETIRVYARKNKFYKTVTFRRNGESSFGWNILEVEACHGADLPDDVVTEPVITSAGLYSVSEGQWISDLWKEKAVYYAELYFGLEPGKYYGQNNDPDDGVGILCQGLSIGDDGVGYYTFTFVGINEQTGQYLILDVAYIQALNFELYDPYA